MKKPVVGITLLLASAVCAPIHAQDPADLQITEFMASNEATLADGDGDFSDWIEIYNPTVEPVPLTGCYLTDNMADLTKWAFPASANAMVPAGGYLIVFASDKGLAGPYVDPTGHVHTSFKLTANGESIALVNTDGTTVISAFVDFPEQGTDVSYGAGANAMDGFFSVPTPGAANGTAGFGFVADTNFSFHRGFYSAPFDVDITCATPGATIRYTLDASTPTESNGTIYTGPIHVSGTTTLRAFAYKTGWFSTDVDTQTYLFLSQVIAQPSTRPNALWPNPTTGSSSVQAIDYQMDPDVTNDPRYSSLMDDALTAVPSIMVTTDVPNLFNTSTGIYMNPANEGDAWERPASVEMILGDGTDAFHVNTGLRIRGGVSRSRSNPKHSLRIIMRTEYGDPKLEYPLFGPDGPQSFDKLDFRTAQNYSWNFGQSGVAANATWLDDPFSRDTMRDMGQPYTAGFFFHLYLNGVYWGLYQTEERPDAEYCKEHFGGPSEDYDVLKNNDDTGVMYAVDGNTTLYNTYWTQVNAGITTAADYMRIQGRNADGTPNAAFPVYLDSDNLIDYMLLVFYTGALDMPLGPPGSQSMPRNLNLFGNRVDQQGFKYLCHDNEWSLVRTQGVNLNRVSHTLAGSLSSQSFFNPWWVHSKLKLNPEYVVEFGDRVHKYFFNNGLLTASKSVARYEERKAEIEMAIIAESARWGDTLNSSDPRTKDDDWLPAVNWIRDNYLNASPSTRSDIVLSQLLSAGLYPSVAAPTYNQFGGTVPSGFNLVISAAAGTIYYTTDGSDPRLIGGAISPLATSGSSGLTVPINIPATVKSRVRNGTTWSALTEAEFETSGVTPSPSPSPTASPSPSASASPTASPSPSASASPSPSASPTPTATPSPSSSPTPTASATASATPSATASATPTATASSSPSPSASPSPSPSATATVSPSPSESPSPSPSVTESPSPSPTETATPTPSPSPSPIPSGLLQMILGLMDPSTKADRNLDEVLDAADAIEG